ncbi:MAG: sulfatase, partial [Acidobacteria bacterium]|nr:sulfatase [Acidobacteriota bacterium]
STKMLAAESSKRPFSSTCAVFLLTLLAVACTESPPDAPATQIDLPTVNRVVLVTIDTLRADHLSSFGYPLETTPWLDSIVERGVVFRRAYSHSATTKPSHSSLFTSLYPLEHGVLKNTQVLSNEFLTMAEMMRSAGYRTAGFVSTDVPLGGNIGQGFEHWDLPKWQDPNAKHSLYRTAEETVNRAIAWLAAEASVDERLFLWVHLYDPHNPLQPPAEHRGVIAAAATQIRDEHTRLLARRDVPARGPSRYDKILRYDGEIRYADSQLARLERSLDQQGLNRNALWIVTSDHGQGLGAHGWFGHSVQIYNAQLHVPLVVWFADGTVPPRDVEDHVVGHVDVLPTLAELVGGDLSAQILPIRGRSLAPFLRGAPAARSRSFAFAQRSEYASPTRRRRSRGNYEPGSRFALQSLDFKYLLFTEGANEFYDLRADPYELVNLIDDPEHQAHSERFKAEIKALVESSTNDRDVGSVSAEDMERLRALGYIQ